MPWVQRDLDGNIISITGVDTDEWVDGPVELYVPVEASRRDAIAAINNAAEAARTRVSPYLKYIDTEYQVLAAQADAYIMAGSPSDPVGLDMLVQSAQDSGRSVAAEAAMVRSKRDAYIALLNATRSLRRQGAAAIDAATDIETIHSVRDQYVDQLASL